MKEFFSNFKVPIIFGGIALVVVIATMIIVTGGFGGDYGLYISTAYGSVSVTNSDTVSSPVSGDKLKKGDILTVGSDSTCTITYKSKKNTENNYMVLGADTQIVLTSDFNGKESGELFLRNGSVIANFADNDIAAINVRTSDSLITMPKSVAKAAYYTNEFMSYTDLYTFMGDNTIQLYDALGIPVNTAEMQIEKKWGRVVSEDGPSFEALNLDIDLNELSASDLKALISIAAIVEDAFPYTAAELKAVYDTKADDSDGISIEQAVTENSGAETTVGIDNSDTIQTAEPIVTTNPPPTETTLPGQTTKAPATTTTAAPTTTAPNTTASETTSGANKSSHIVTIIIDGEETIQEVPHGGSATKPDDPEIEGMAFIGWDNSFDNITEDTVITALFEVKTSVMHTVTVVIGDKSTTIQVEHGKAANLPSTVNLDGYVFLGWDKDYSCVTEDMTVSAIIAKSTYTVTFVVDGTNYTIEVKYGDTAIPPYIPDASTGFVGWDKSLGNITADTTITAVYENSNYHNVTFIIDGKFYFIKVEHGGTAVPPVDYLTSSSGGTFLFWDRSLENITSDVVITAYYG